MDESGVRRLIAAVIDVAAIAILGLLAFRCALWIEPCGGGQCPLLAPLSVVLMLLALLLYFGAGHFLWHTTPGEHIAGPK